MKRIVGCLCIGILCVLSMCSCGTNGNVVENEKIANETESGYNNEVTLLELTDAYWENSIQCPAMYAFLDDGRCVEYLVDP